MSVCDKHDLSLKAVQAAKIIADEMQIIMVEVLKKFSVHDMGMFQGQVCDCLSSFILSISIKILQMNKVPPATIVDICKNNTEMAFEYAKNSKISFHRDH